MGEIWFIRNPLHILALSEKHSVILVGLALTITCILVFSIQASAEKEYSIPAWIKNNAKWWAAGQIGDSDFVQGIQYLIEQKIMKIPETKQLTKSNQAIPAWIKNNAKWWSEGQIGDSDFIQGIQYLIQQGIIHLGISKEKEHDVIVIGAGIAGIAAAKELDSKGFDVVVLEAQQRIGGRVWTDHSINGIPLDLEASWIHGVNENPIMELAKKYGIKTVPTDYDSITVYDSEGKKVDKERISEMHARFAQFERFIEDERESRSKDTSLQEAIDDFIQKQNLSKQQIEDFLYDVNTRIEHEYGADASDLSLFYFDTDSAFSGEDVLFPGGYDQIISNLAKGLDIRLEQRVKSVDYNNNGVNVGTIQGTFKAKYVVCALPLGVLKKGDVKFFPPLPDRKVKAIQNLKMGILNKVYLLFPDVFWDKDDELIGYIASEKGHWAEFYNMYHYIAEPILLAFNAGKYGHEIENLSDKEIVASEMSVLKKIYGEKVPPPKDYIVTRWGSFEFTGGSYSYTPVGATDEDYDALAEPVMDKVFFAGEATSKKYHATVHGAYLSGIREADRIDEFVHRKIPNAPIITTR